MKCDLTSVRSLPLVRANGGDQVKTWSRKEQAA